MARFIPIFVGLVFVALLSIGVITFGIMAANQNNAEINIGQNEELSAFYSTLNNTLKTTATDAGASSESLTNSTVSTTGTIPYLNTLGGIWKVISNSPKLVWGAISGLVFDNLLGSEAGQIVAISIGAIFAVMLISAVVLWIMWGQGG